MEAKSEDSATIHEVCDTDHCKSKEYGLYGLPAPYLN